LDPKEVKMNAVRIVTVSGRPVVLLGEDEEANATIVNNLTTDLPQRKVNIVEVPVGRGLEALKIQIQRGLAWVTDELYNSCQLVTSAEFSAAEDDSQMALTTYGRDGSLRDTQLLEKEKARLEYKRLQKQEGFAVSENNPLVLINMH
jgi:hypothetical protein